MVRQVSFFLLVLSFLFLAACQNDASVKNVQKYQLSNYESGIYAGPSIKFDTTTYNFGRVYEGEKVCWYFKYQNRGNKNLVLTNVTTSCGCTIPAYSNEPVAPGNKGNIKVVFDTSDRIGHQYKTVEVQTNGEPGKVELIITAEVIKK
jgi:hypothetical protein